MANTERRPPGAVRRSRGPWVAHRWQSAFADCDLSIFRAPGRAAAPAATIVPVIAFAFAFPVRVRRMLHHRDEVTRSSRAPVGHLVSTESIDREPYLVHRHRDSRDRYAHTTQSLLCTSLQSTLLLSCFWQDDSRTSFRNGRGVKEDHSVVASEWPRSADTKQVRRDATYMVHGQICYTYCFAVHSTRLNFGGADAISNEELYE